MASNGPSPESSSKSGSSVSSKTTESQIETEIERLRTLSLQGSQRHSSSSTAETNEKKTSRPSLFRSASIGRLTNRGSNIISSAAASAAPSPTPLSRAQVTQQLKANNLCLQEIAGKIEEILEHQPDATNRMGEEAASLPPQRTFLSFDEALQVLCTTVSPKRKILSLDEALLLLCTAVSPKRSYKIAHVIGLSEMYPVQVILECLSNVFQRFTRAEKINALRLLSDLILHDRFNSEYCDPNFLNKLIPFFDQTFAHLYPHFEKMVTAKSRGVSLEKTLTSLNLFTGARHIKPFEEILTKSLKNSEIKDKARKVAHELRALSLQFYREVQPSEFRNRAWKNDETKNITSATLLQQLTLSTKISSFFISRILKAESDEQRIYNIKLIILILKDLTEEKKLPDYNTAMSVLASLNNSYVSRLKLMQNLKQKYKTILENISALLSETRNFPLLRSKTQPSRCIPFLGVKLKDLVVGNEGNPDNLLVKWETLGEIYYDLFMHLNALKEVTDIVPQSLLLQTLNQTPDIDSSEEQFSQLSYHIKRKVTPPEVPLLEEAATTLTPSYTAAAAAASPPAIQSTSSSSRLSNGKKDKRASRIGGSFFGK